MAYRVTLLVDSDSIQYDKDGNLIRSTAGLAKLAEMGVPDSEMSSIQRHPNGTATTTRDFATEALANEWLAFWQTRAPYISGSVSEI